MDDLNNNNENLEVRGAGGGGGGGKQTVKQNVTVVAPTRQPVIETDNLFSVAFAKTVYAIGEGVIEGFPNSIEKDVFLDSVPIKNPDDSENFTGYEVDFRLGEDETQTPIEGFSTTENTVGVNVAITQSTGAITRSITDTDTERCRVIVSHPSLQTQNPDNGDISGTTVEYKIEVNSNGGPYSTVAQPVVTGKSDSEFQRAYEFDLPGTGPWNIRLSRVTADSNSVYLQNAISWQAYVEIIDEKFAYPNTALVALKVDARQFNNIPDVSMRIRGKRVQVPSNYNAETRVYTGIWDGTFQMAWTDNPAWIFRDIVVNDRFGVARYVNSIAIDPWYLYTVSQYCDELVPDGSGGTEPRFTCNVYLQNAGGVYEVLNALASCFRGLIYYSEGELYITQDREQLPVQQFSEANVIQDVAENGEVSSPCFTYSGTARAARKTVVLANWDDPNQAYSSVTEYQQDDELLERFGYNPVDLRLLGVTSRGQALRAAKHTLFSNRYETERISFRIGAEGLAAGVGEVIQVADPLKQGQRLGGRITEVNGNDIVIDASLTLSESIEYTLTLVIPDGETITNPDGTTVTRPKLQVYNVVSSQTAGFEISEANLTSQDEDPLLTQNSDNLIARIISSDASKTRIHLDSLVDTQVGSLWVLEWSAMQAALYKVISVAEIEPLIYQVDAVQYNNSKFAYVDNDLPIAVPKDRFKLRAVEKPTDLEAALVYSNGQTSIVANWKAPQFNNTIDLFIRGYRYQWRKVGDTEWSDIRQQNASTVDIPLAKHVFGNSYQVRVATINRLGGQSDWTNYDVEPFDPIPDLSDVTYNATIRHQNQPDGTQLLIINSGTCPIPERVKGFRCWAKALDVPTVIPGVKEPDAEGWYFLSDIPLTGYYTVAFHAPGDWQLRVAFTSSIYGEEPTDYLYDTVDREEIVPPTPESFSVVENSNQSGKRFSWQIPLTDYGSWDQNLVSDIVGYEVRYKRGTLVNSSPSETWDAGIELASGGLPAQQQWFETSLFDTDEWVVMVKAIDATQWRSDVPAYILVNIGAPPISNAVQSINARTQGAGSWDGDYENCSVDGSGDLVQTDATQDSYFNWIFDNNNLESALLFSTTATATYQHKIAALTGEAIELTQEDDFNLLQENDDLIFTEQRYYTGSELAEGGVLHPYAPYEKLLADVYRVQTLFKSPDGGVTAGKLTALTAQLDYPDVVEKINDASISSSGTAVNLTKTFRSVESVSVTALQGSTAVTARIVAKTTSAVTVECLNSSGTAVSGTVDLIVTGY
jgi:predicted phage tail protein